MEIVLYDILYQSDITDLVKLCLINKQSKNICYNKHFWLEKYKKHNLVPQLLNIIPHQWISEYVADLKTTQIIDYLHQKMSIEKYLGDNYIVRFNVCEFSNINDMYFLPQKIINEIHYRKVEKNKPELLNFGIHLRGVDEYGESTIDYYMLISAICFYDNKRCVDVGVFLEDLYKPIFDLCYYYLIRHISIHYTMNC